MTLPLSSRTFSLKGVNVASPQWWLCWIPLPLPPSIFSFSLKFLQYFQKSNATDTTFFTKILSWQFFISSYLDLPLTALYFLPFTAWHLNVFKIMSFNGQMKLVWDLTAPILMEMDGGTKLIPNWNFRIGIATSRTIWA